MHVRSIKRRFGAVFFHPYFLSMMNLLMMILVYSSLKATWFDLNPANHFDEAVELWEGYGTILLGFGVILEERATLRQILGTEPQSSTVARPAAVEHVSHDYGTIFVVFGVLIELFAWLVKNPNAALDTYGIELAFINVAAVTAVFGAFLQLKFQWEVVNAYFKDARS